MQPASGALQWGGGRGPPLAGGAFRGCNPPRLLAGTPTDPLPHTPSSHSDEPGRAGRGRRGASAPLALPSRQGAARRAGLGAGAVEPRVACSTRRRTGPLRLQIQQVRGAPGNLCAPQGPRRWGAAASRAWAPVPVPETSPAGPGPRCARPPRRLSRRRAGGGGWRAREGGWARPIFVLPCFPPRGPACQRFPSPRPGRGAAGEARAGCAAEAALRAARRVWGAPATIQLPGLVGGRGVRRGAGSQRAAAAAASRASRALAGAAAQPRARAR